MSIGHVAWVSDALSDAIRLVPIGLEVTVQIYVTGESVSQRLDNVSMKSCKEIHGTDNETRSPSLFDDPAVQIISGTRPNLAFTLKKEADLTSGRMGVTGLRYRLSVDPSLVANMHQ